MTEVRQEILISRIIDGDANTAEWEELTALAERDPRLWRTVVESVRDHQAFTRGMMAAAAAADRINALSTSAHDTRGMIGRIGSWSGWGVAAVVALVWIIGLSVVPEAGADDLTPEQHFDRYVELGQARGLVMNELSERIVLQILPDRQGGPTRMMVLRGAIELVADVGDGMYINEQDAQGQNVFFPLRDAIAGRLDVRLAQID